MSIISNYAHQLKPSILRLFLISFLILYLEIACIRWIPANISVLAYYSNVILISCFLGLGIGCLLAHHPRKLIKIFPFTFGLTVLLAITFERNTTPSLYAQIMVVGTLILTLVFLLVISKYLGRYFAISTIILAIIGLFIIISPGSIGNIVKQFSEGIHIWDLRYRIKLYALITPFVFILNCLNFMALGQILGQEMALHLPLKAYMINIFGSLIGIVGFAIISFGEIPPPYWFAISFILLIPFLWVERRIIISLIIFVGAIAIIYCSSAGLFWSPYYKIKLFEPESDGTFSLDVNDCFHQVTLNLSESNVRNNSERAHWKRLYDLPYQFFMPKKVLVVGAGTGNDVAAAIRYKVPEIHAVEIDPVILRIGKKRHPEHPYDHPSVKLIIDDARSYFRNTDERYDLIVYGLLDSHTIFSSMSSVRLESFVYTLEGIKEAKNILTDKGIIYISFCVSERHWISDKISNMLKEAFGSKPLILGFTFDERKLPPTIFLISNSVDMQTFGSIGEFEKQDFPAEVDVTIPTDDWPHLYIKVKSLTTTYTITLAILLILSLLISFIVIKRVTKFSPFFFALGLAFMLLETKSISSASLLFGATWIVSSVIIASILALILIANFIIMSLKRPLQKLWIIWLLLFISIIANYLIPTSSFLIENMLIRIIIAGGIITIPIFFAALLFSNYFQQTKDIPNALGANLIGAVIGGFGEYSSLLFGYKALFIFIAVFYLIGWLCVKKIK